MPRDRVSSENEEAELNEAALRVRPLRGDEVNRTLTAGLVRHVDLIRQIATTLGTRPYRVFLIHLRWTGARRGQGVPEVISEREILPTPQVSDLTSLPELLQPTGRVEEGGLSVSEISARYSEDDLRGLTPDLIDPTNPRTLLPNVEFFWEVVEQRPNRPAPVRRRFTMGAAPVSSKDSLQWRVELTRQDYDRGRGGQVRGGP